MTRTRSIVVASCIAIVATATGVLAAHAWLARASVAPPLVQGTLIDPPRPIPAFALVDQSGQPFDNERLRSHWSFVFFGFTHCPDICPTTLSALAQVEKHLSDLPVGSRPQVVLVSVDPDRDTPAVLAPYIRVFDPSFTGVTGAPEAIAALARAMGVATDVDADAPGGYSVVHSAAIFLVDRDGAMRALFSAPHTVSLIADDYRRVIAAGG